MKILLAIDESWCSEDAVAEVSQRSSEPDTTVRLLHVIERRVPPVVGGWYHVGGTADVAKYELTERNESLINGIANRLRLHGLNVETVVRKGNPQEAIVDEAYEWGADLIVVGSHNYSRLVRFLVGSSSPN